MNRLDIINFLIKKNGYNSYGEIGVFTGFTLDGCILESKFGIDPQPGHYIGSQKVYPITSDQFFAQLDKEFRVDIWFIDGFHEANQVLKDVYNASKHLNPGGVIVMHDCNPPLYEHTTTGVGGCWTGDVYKAAMVLKGTNKDMDGVAMYDDFYVIDTDWGVGVLKPKNVAQSTIIDVPTTDWWKIFSEKRKENLNLISIEEFLEREPINQVA